MITDFSDKSRKISNVKSVIIVDSNYINFLPSDIKFIKSIEYDLNKYNFSYTIDKNERVIIDIYQRDKVFFICYLIGPCFQNFQIV